MRLCVSMCFFFTFEQTLENKLLLIEVMEHVPFKFFGLTRLDHLHLATSHIAELKN